MSNVGHLFVGRLNKRVKVSDVEKMFGQYGRMSRCDVKYGDDMAFAFIDFEDKRDAEDAMKNEDGRDFMGTRIVVEWTRSSKREPESYDKSSSSRGGYDRRDKDRYREKERDRYSSRDSRRRRTYSRSRSR